MKLKDFCFCVKNIKELLRIAKESILSKGVFYEYRFLNIYSNQFKNYLRTHQFENKPIPGEAEFLSRWGGKNVEPYSYRFYSHFVTNPQIIISEGIAHLYVEQVLNNRNQNLFYSDKNSYDLYLKDIPRPKTLLRRDGNDFLMDKNYDVVASCNDSNMSFYECFEKESSVIIKPTIDSCSGIGVEKFIYDEKSGNYKNSQGVILSLNYLKQKYNHFIIQSCISQSAFMSNFCSSAVNTLRVCMYKSVVSGQWKITAAVLRVGLEGKVVDNAHAGGGMLKIDLLSGDLGNKVMFSNGKSDTKWNGIDFTQKSYKVPNWQYVKDLALKIAQRYYSFHLIALDICLDESNNPILIEVNTNQFSFWIPLYFDYDVFAGELDDVIKYCSVPQKLNID